MNKKSKKLLSNTLLFMLGNIGSKFIQFFLVPLYTYTLASNEFGNADLLLTTINFLIPIFFIQIGDGLLRFGLNKNKKQEEIINSSFKIAMVGSIISILFSPIFLLFDGLSNLVIYFILILNLRIYRDLFAITLKINDKNKLYAIDSILYTFVLCMCSVLFLVSLKLGIHGYFLSYIVANVFSIAFIIIVSKFNILLLFKKYKKNSIKELAIYSAPLVINSISYWIITASDRYMINWFINESAVGIYAIAAKIPTILTTLTGVFNQAWLISSINEYETEKDYSFYIKTYKRFSAISFIIAGLIILFTKPFMGLYVSNSYYEAWQYVPLLTVSAIFSGLSAFLNNIYYAFKKNKLVTGTTFIGALINIILNLLLIPHYGIFGASIATLISWIIVTILRILKMKNLIKISFSYINFYVSSLLIVIEMLLITFYNNFIGYIITTILYIIIILINRKILVIIIKNLMNKIKSKK